MRRTAATERRLRGAVRFGQRSDGKRGSSGAPTLEERGAANERRRRWETRLSPSAGYMYHHAPLRTCVTPSTEHTHDAQQRAGRLCGVRHTRRTRHTRPRVLFVLLLRIPSSLVRAPEDRNAPRPHSACWSWPVLGGLLAAAAATGLLLGCCWAARLCAQASLLRARRRGAGGWHPASRYSSVVCWCASKKRPLLNFFSSNARRRGGKQRTKGGGVAAKE